MSKGTRRGKKPAVAPIESRTRIAASSGNNIRNWRLFKGLAKQEDLARLTQLHDPERIGIPRVTICRLESGETRYNEDHLRLISSALGVSPRDLIGTNPFDAGDIFAVYEGLSWADKRAAMKLLTTLTRPKSRNS
jgi:transcriptional regulator with XRE-family HTH domain